LSADLLGVIFSKTGSNKTVKRLDAYLLYTIFASLAVSTTPVWLASPSTDDPQVSAQRSLAVRCYRTIHANSRWPLSRSLFAQLVGNIGARQLLAFLASIWVSPAEGRGLRTAALRDAKNFVEASSVGKKRMDFQVVLPPALIALSQGEKEERREALDLLQAIQRVAESDEGQSSVYGYDAFYGPTSSKRLSSQGWWL
jgi:hypothetical protein